MSMIDFEQAKLLKEDALTKLEQHAIQLKIPTNEVSYWIHTLTYLTHTIGFFLKNERDSKEKNLLQKEYTIMNDLMEKMLVFSGIVTVSNNDLSFSISYEEMIILEGQLELYTQVCQNQNDSEYLELTNKYLNTLYKVMDEEASLIDMMTRILVKSTSPKLN
ncbi:hypothetical protein [Bacillus pinisoli]|uniref:hypothetical protein n=1 Tax=Bacillus pinisoli TaxID=2901866 RepID=UPI001FF346EC|nr:hypothetical protein [Bacillus pinisoli]